MHYRVEYKIKGHLGLPRGGKREWKLDAGYRFRETAIERFREMVADYKGQYWRIVSPSGEVELEHTPK